MFGLYPLLDLVLIAGAVSVAMTGIGVLFLRVFKVADKVADRVAHTLKSKLETMFDAFFDEKVAEGYIVSRAKIIETIDDKIALSRSDVVVEIDNRIRRATEPMYGLLHEMMYTLQELKTNGGFSVKDQIAEMHQNMVEKKEHEQDTGENPSI